MIKAQTANTRRISRRNFTWEDPVWLSWTATAGVLLAELMRRFVLIGVPYLWLLLLFLVPVHNRSENLPVRHRAVDSALHADVLDWSDIGTFFRELDFENFVWLTEDDLYWKAYLSSLLIAVVSTFFTLLIGYPIAYGMARAPEEWRPTLMMLVILPFWTSFLIRVYAWMGILSQEGFLNQLFCCGSASSTRH